jgi:4-hydroxy-tetrahydrodipicolinate synthase
MGVFSPLSGVAPLLVKQVYELCVAQKFTQARADQENLGELAHRVKMAGLAGLKGALRAMGRDCGRPRPPARALTAAEQSALASDLQAMQFLQAEPRGW